MSDVMLTLDEKEIISIALLSIQNQLAGALKGEQGKDARADANRLLEPYLAARRKIKREDHTESDIVRNYLLSGVTAEIVEEKAPPKLAPKLADCPICKNTKFVIAQEDGSFISAGEVDNGAIRCIICNDPNIVG